MVHISRPWEEFRVFRKLDVSVPVECELINAHKSRYDYTLTLHTEKRKWKVNSSVLESILGLTVWSLMLANDIEFGSRFFRVFDAGYDNLTRLRRTYCKWVANEVPLDQGESSRLFTGSDTFGAESAISRNVPEHNVMFAPVDSDLIMLAAQDLYILFLRKSLQYAATTSGKTRIVGQNPSFRGHHDFIQELIAPFVKYGLGSERDALVCIIPELEKSDKLPDLIMENVSLWEQVEDLIKDGDWDKAIDLAEWMLALSEPHYLHSSAVELGYVLLRGFMETGGMTIRCRMAEDILRFKQLEGAPYLSSRLAIPENLMSHIPETLWQSFGEQLFLLACGIAQYEATFRKNGIPTLSLNPGTLSDNTTNSGPSNCVYLDCESAQTAWGYLLRLWYDHPLDVNEAIIGRKMCLDLLLQDVGNHMILEWLIVHYIRTVLEFDRIDEELIFMIRDSVKRGDRKLIKCVVEQKRFIRNYGLLWDFPIEELVRDGDNQALDIMLTCVFDNGDWIGYPPGEITALVFAAKHDKTEVARHILERGVPVGVNIPNRSGETALTTAAEHRSRSMVEFLVEKGAVVDCQDPEGRTALMLATGNRDLQMVKYLLDHGADVHIKANDESTALQFAQFGYVDGPWMEGIEILTAAGATS